VSYRQRGKRLEELSTRYGVLIQFKLWLTLQDQITALERWIRKDLARPDLLVRLQSVPGIGPILGTTILLESGDVARFASVGDYASYCRMVESVRLTEPDSDPVLPLLRFRCSPGFSAVTTTAPLVAEFLAHAADAPSDPKLSGLQRLPAISRVALEPVVCAH